MRFGSETMLWGHRINDLEDVLASIAHAGFQGVEFVQRPENLGGVTDLTALRAQAKRHGLEVIGLVGGTLQERMEFCGQDRSAYLVFQDKVESNWNEGIVLKALQQEFTLALHPHAFKAIRRLKDTKAIFEAHPAIRFCPDTAHLTIVGDLPDEAVRKYCDRLVAVHLKDWTPQFGRSCHRYAHGFTELGRGRVRLEETLDALRACNYRGWVVVEQDTPASTPQDSLRAATEWLADYLGRRGEAVPPPFRPRTRVIANSSRESRPAAPPAESAENATRELLFARAVLQTGADSGDHAYQDIACAFARLLPCSFASIWACSQCNDVVSLLAVEPPDVQLDRMVLYPTESLSGVALDRRTVTRFDLTEPSPGGRFGYPGVQFGFPRLRDVGDLRMLISIPLLNESSLNHVRLVVHLALDEGGQAAAANITDDELFRYGTYVSMVSQSLLDRRCSLAAAGANSLVASHHDLDPYLRSLLILISEIVDCEAVTIFLVNDLGNRLEEAATTGIRWDPAIPESSLYYVREEETSTARAWRDREAILTADQRPGESPHVPKSTEIIDSPQLLNGSIIVPMITAEGGVMGVIRCRNKLGVLDHVPNLFSDDDTAVIEAIGQAAVPHIRGMQLENRRRDTVSRLSHELKWPLWGVRSAVEYVEDGLREKGFSNPANFSKFDYIGDIKDFTALMVEWIDYADFTKYTTRPLRLHPVSTLLRGQIIAPAVRHIRKLLDDQGFSSRGIEYTGFGAKADGHNRTASYDAMTQVPVLYLDRQRMRQVFFNLLANAIRFAFKDPSAFHVEIVGTAVGDEYFIHVRDFGEGIVAGTEEIIFKEGIRASKSVGGDGLGLWIVRRIMEAHGGRVSVTRFSNPTEITLVLPAKLRTFPHHLPAVQAGLIPLY